MSLVRIGRQGKLILKWKYFARILLSLQAITMGKWEEIEYLPTEHFDILPYNMSIPAGVPLLLPQSPWFSNGAKGFNRSVNLKIYLRCDENASSPIYSPLFPRDITSLHCLVLKWVPHHFGCKFKSLFTNGKWLKHKNKNTAFLKRKVVVRFSVAKMPSEADPPYCCWLPPPPPTTITGSTGHPIYYHWVWPGALLLILVSQPTFPYASAILKIFRKKMTIVSPYA